MEAILKPRSEAEIREAYIQLAMQDLGYIGKFTALGYLDRRLVLCTAEALRQAGRAA